ncbi:hypothetical protein ACQ858_06080 [Variovorax ureilyticus]|uniref:hypothetical protein n=1 Tax=Variovorax ureilyticus TaxID=1836198 RepID=UPI003D6743FA
MQKARKEDPGVGSCRCRVGSRMLQIPSTLLLAKELNDQLVAWGPPRSKGRLELDVLAIHVLLSQWGVLLDERDIERTSSRRGDVMKVSLSFLPWWDEAFVNRLYEKTQDDVRKGLAERHDDQYGLEIYTGTARSHFCYEASDGSSVVIYRVPMPNGLTGCRVAVVLWAGYELGYTLPVDYLPEWRRIDQGLRTLFNGFVVEQ